MNKEELLKQALILAGGKGMRLKSITKGSQKVLIKVGNKSFLEILLAKLKKEKFDAVNIAVGYKAEDVSLLVSKSKISLDINLIYEKEPLGTGGAIFNAFQYIDEENILVLNGDSYNDIDYSKFLDSHLDSQNDISILTKEIDDIRRYGQVITDQSKRIIKFNEKSSLNINGQISLGVYGINKNVFKNCANRVFSFENFLSQKTGELIIGAIQMDGHFIDIGIPEDYYQFLKIYKE